ncbi:MAG TPA: hypothetical protein VFL85_01475 [Candidatus Saccharimonadales bacterium]|nr:hypothetical protein [Candidatus Saccharimonadales bacterium]
MDNQLSYTYAQAGFNGFLNRSIDSSNAVTLQQASSDFRKVNNPSINFDQTQTTGSLGSTIQVGDHISIDGVIGRISVTDEGNNEVTRLGKITD